MLKSLGMRCFFLFLFSFLIYISLYSQPKHEIRAVWLTTNYALDWPSVQVNSKDDIDKQKKELINILDQLKTANFNMIFLQARIRGDVIYRSKIEPQTFFIKGKYNDPYDPLNFAIEECHKRGMECHAWFVAYPLGKKSGIRNSPSNHNPQVKKHQGNFYLDPGDPESSSYLLSLIKEVVESYDVDGIHFDYIRYPEKAESFPDKDNHKKYGKYENLSAWRRDNINRFVYQAYDEIKKLKPWVQVSSSTIGIYRRDARISNSDWTAYDKVMQDPNDWTKKGKHDFIVPMMYFKGDCFFSFIEQWKEVSNGRFIVPGLGVYQLNPDERNWNPEIITRQIDYCRNSGVQGNAFFRAKNLSDDTKGILSEIKNHYYQSPALLPAFIWLDSIAPSRPDVIEGIINDQSIQLSWSKVKESQNEKILYTVYRSEISPIDINNPENILFTYVKESNVKILIDHSTINGYFYTVTANDRYHNESEASSSVYIVTGIEK